MKRWTVLCLAGLTACRPAPSDVRMEGATMGSTWHATLVLDSTAEGETFRSLIQERLDALEAIFTNWREHSAVSTFNRSASTGWQPVPRELVEVVQSAAKFSRLTSGAFDVTVAPLIERWGFGGKPRPNQLPSDDEIAALLSAVGWKKLETRLDPPALRKTDSRIRINVSALVEGYAIDDLSRRLRARGMANFLLEVGGEVFASGRKADGQPWRVGVEAPKMLRPELATVIALENQAISTAGVSKQYFETNGRRYAHILDARTGKPVDHTLQSVSVIAGNCLEADGWSTALLILGAESGRDLAEKHGIQALFLDKTAQINQK